MTESSVAANSNVILPYRFKPNSLGVAVKRVTAMIPIAKQVLLKDWATLPGVVAQNVYLCHVLLSAFVAVSYQRL